jgi:hypothetical protein
MRILYGVVLVLRSAPGVNKGLIHEMTRSRTKTLRGTIFDPLQQPRAT